jgi:hypothetical protein
MATHWPHLSCRDCELSDHCQDCTVSSYRRTKNTPERGFGAKNVALGGMTPPASETLITEAMVGG